MQYLVHPGSQSLKYPEKMIFKELFGYGILLGEGTLCLGEGEGAAVKILCNLLPICFSSLVCSSLPTGVTSSCHTVFYTWQHGTLAHISAPSVLPPLSPPHLCNKVLLSFAFQMQLPFMKTISSLLPHLHSLCPKTDSCAPLESLKFFKYLPEPISVCRVQKVYFTHLGLPKQSKPLQ